MKQYIATVAIESDLEIRVISDMIDDLLTRKVNFSSGTQATITHTEIASVD
jgi:hypothetical protein